MPNWDKWIFASVAGAAKEVATSASLPAIIEHLDTRTQAFMESADRAEIRVTGPFTYEQSKDLFWVEVFVNVLLTSRNTSDPYALIEFAGLFHERFHSPIQVLTYGDGDEFLECLYPATGSKGSVKTYHLGPLTETDHVRQTIVDAKYEGYFKTI